MASKKELEADNVELRKLAERTAGDLLSFADELDFVFEHGGDAAVGLLAGRARSLGELLATTLLEEFDAEAVGLIARIARHWIAKAVAVGLVEHFSAKYGGPAIEQMVGAVAGSLDSLLEAVGVASDLASSVPAPSRQQDATVQPESVDLRVDIPGVVDSRDEAAGVGEASRGGGYLLTEDGERILTENGDPISVEEGSTIPALSADQRREITEEFLADPANAELVEEWNAESQWDEDTARGR